MSTTTPTTHTALKRHQCDLCGEFIPAGSMYTRWRFFSDHDAATVKVHPDCNTEAKEYDWYADEWQGDFPLAEERAQAGGEG